MFGGDVAVLMQILAENIEQYEELQMMLGQGKDQMEFMKSLNSGLENSVGLLKTLPIKDEGILNDIRSFNGSVGKVESIYGKIPVSSVKASHELHDQTVAESFQMVHASEEFSEIQEQNADFIRRDSRSASPKGAARMQAETSAEILRTLSQLLRLNTQALKIQSEGLAMNNQRSKEDVSNFQKINRDLGNGFSHFIPDMELIRF